MERQGAKEAGAAEVTTEGYTGNTPATVMPGAGGADGNCGSNGGLGDTEVGRVAMTPSRANPARAQAMLGLWLSGKTLQEIASEYGISRQRVHQILLRTPGYYPGRLVMALCTAVRISGYPAKMLRELVPIVRRRDGSDNDSWCYVERARIAALPQRRCPQCGVPIEGANRVYCTLWCRDRQKRMRVHIIKSRRDYQRAWIRHKRARERGGAITTDSHGASS